LPFSIDFDRRPYNTLALPCECVISLYAFLGALTEFSQLQNSLWVQQRALTKLSGVIQGMELRNFCRGRLPYSAGRPSRWVSAHISSSFFFLLSSFLSLPYLSDCRMDVYHTSTHGVALVRIECRSEMCCTRLAGNAGRQKSPKIRRLRTIAQLCRAIGLSSQLRRVSTIGKKIDKQQYLLQMFSQYGELRPTTAEIDWRVWGTPVYFNGYRVLASLLQRRCSTEVNQTA